MKQPCQRGELQQEKVKETSSHTQQLWKSGKSTKQNKENSRSGKRRGTDLGDRKHPFAFALKYFNELLILLAISPIQVPTKCLAYSRTSYLFHDRLPNFGSI